jgi:hypothetical protein
MRSPGKAWASPVSAFTAFRAGSAELPSLPLPSEHVSAEGNYQ